MTKYWGLNGERSQPGQRLPNSAPSHNTYIYVKSSALRTASDSVLCSDCFVYRVFLKINHSRHRCRLKSTCACVFYSARLCCCDKCTVFLTEYLCETRDTFCGGCDLIVFSWLFQFCAILLKKKTRYLEFGCSKNFWSIVKGIYRDFRFLSISVYQKMVNIKIIVVISVVIVISKVNAEQFVYRGNETCSKSIIYEIHLRNLNFHAENRKLKALKWINFIGFYLFCGNI